jgi:peptidoglycan hydrolase CwlO-like protein
MFRTWLLRASVALLPMVLTFSVWAADKFINEVVESKVVQLDKRLYAIELQLTKIQQELEDLKNLSP